MQFVQAEGLGINCKPRGSAADRGASLAQGTIGILGYMGEFLRFVQAEGLGINRKPRGSAADRGASLAQGTIKEKGGKENEIIIFKVALDE